MVTHGHTEHSAPPGDPSIRWLPVPLLLAVAGSWRVLPAGPVPRGLPGLEALLGPLGLTAPAGSPPWAPQAASLALHLLVTLLAFAFARAVLRLAGAAHPTGLAVAAAGAFALHPLQTEAVNHPAHRGVPLAAGVALAALLLLLEAERRGLGRRGAAAWLGALALFALGLRAGGSPATVPLAWLLVAFAVPTAAARATLASWPRRVLLLLPFAAVAEALARHGAGPLAGPLGGPAGAALPPLAWFLTQWRVLLTCLRLVVWPVGQSAVWDFPPSDTLADPAVAMAGLALLAVLAAAWSLLSFGRRWPDGDPDRAAARLAAFGVAWFFLVLAAAAAVAPRLEPLAEHRAYLAVLGAFLAVAVGGERLLAHQELPEPRRAAAAAMLTGAVWLGLAAGLHRRNAAWEGPLAPWRDAVQEAPRSAAAALALAEAALATGELAEAERAAARAVDLAPGEARARRLLELVRLRRASGGDQGPEGADGAPARR